MYIPEVVAINCFLSVKMNKYFCQVTQEVFREGCWKRSV